jgi:hypothetical protein
MTPPEQLKLLMKEDVGPEKLFALFDKVDVEAAECYSAAAEKVIHDNIRSRSGSLTALTNGASHYGGEARRVL